MTLTDVLAICHRRRVTLTSGGDRLKFTGPTGAVDAELKALLLEHKERLLELVAQCPGCHRPLDSGRCWWCHYRRCSCCRVRNTGSAFLAVCLACELSSEGTV
jgi:hypothetical protein